MGNPRNEGLTFPTLPAWQRRGIVVSTEEYEISGFNPIFGKETNLCTETLQTGKFLNSMERRD